MVSTLRGNKEASGYKPFSSEQLKEFVEVQTWLKNISPGSTKVYLRALWMFCNWCEKSPHELIMQRDKEIRIAANVSIDIPFSISTGVEEIIRILKSI